MRSAVTIERLEAIESSSALTLANAVMRNVLRYRRFLLGQVPDADHAIRQRNHQVAELESRVCEMLNLRRKLHARGVRRERPEVSAFATPAPTGGVRGSRKTVDGPRVHVGPGYACASVATEWHYGFNRPHVDVFVETADRAQFSTHLSVTDPAAAVRAAERYLRACVDLMRAKIDKKESVS